MTVFQSASQLASWAGVCSGNNESAGKRKSSRIPKGNVYLKTALVEGKRQSRKHKLDERGILLTTDAERPRQLG
jgi:transposase